MRQCLREQRGAGDEDDRERDFDGDERLPHTRRATASGALRRRRRDARARGDHRRKGPEQRAAYDRHNGGTHQRGRVDRDRFPGDEIRRAQRIDERLREPRERHAAQRADDREQHALGQQLAHDAHPVGADRHTHGELAAARDAVRQQQTGDVGARDEEQQRDRADHRAQHAGRFADDRLARRNHRDAPLLLLREFAAQRRRDIMQLAIGRRDRDPVAHARDGEQRVARSVLAIRRRQRHRHPHLLLRRRKHESARHDADDGVRTIVEHDRAAEDRRAAIPRGPERVADERDVLVARLKFLVGEQTAVDRLHTDRFAESARHSADVHLLGLAIGCQILLPLIDRGEC